MTSKGKSQLVGEILGLIVVGVAALTIKAWLLTLILGWFGIAAFGFWKAVVVVVFLDFIFNSNTNRK